MRFLIAFDKFKDSLEAEQACSIAASAILKLNPEAEIIIKPLADGGEGFCSILTKATDGTLISEEIYGPQGELQKAQWGIVGVEKIPLAARKVMSLKESGKVAVIEMAQASGLESIVASKRDPWIASTFGTGQLIEKAAKVPVDAILLGLGGSATNDIGLGALAALGLKFLDETGTEVSDVSPRNWGKVNSISGEILDTLPPIYIACDVSNPLLGEKGATRVYGVQKGLLEADVGKLEVSVEQLSGLLCDYFQEPMSSREIAGCGAAGGIGFGLKIATGAHFVPGFHLVKEWLNLEEEVEKADFIITGEGSFDSSSLYGKGPYSVVEMAVANHKPVSVFAGRVTPEAVSALAKQNSTAIACQISPKGLSLLDCLAGASNFLEQKVLETFKKKLHL